jgi:hypothetical protein
MRYLSPIDLNQNELRNFIVQNLASAPSSPKNGQGFYNTATNKIGYYTPSGWAYLLTSLDLGVASGVATLNANSLVIQNPANASTTAGANKIPLADGTGKIDNAYLKTGAGNGLDADTLDAQHGAYYLSRTNHTGTQTASTISDLATVVQAYTLNLFAAPTASINLNSQKIINLLDPTNPQDAVTKNYVDTNLQGLKAKGSVLCATTANITLSGTQTIDGVSADVNSLVLVKDQTTQSQNGIYVVQSGAWTRASNADTWTELVSAYVFIEQGTLYADTGWTCTVNAGGTLGTTNVTWVQFSSAGQTTASNVNTLGVGVFKQKSGINFEFRGVNAASSKLTTTLNATSNTIDLDVTEANLSLTNIGGTLTVAKGGTGATTASGARTNLGATGKYSISIGDGSATSYVITHNLNTQDVIVSVAETASPYNIVIPDVQLTSANTITILFTTAPTTNQYRVTVIG